VPGHTRHTHSPSMFGSTAGTTGGAGGFSFGGGSAGAAAAPASSSTPSFSFGASAPAASTSTTGGGFSFGANAAAPAAASSTTGSSFGFGASAAPTAPAAAPASTGFSFGGASTAAAAPASTGSGFSFGAATGAAAPATTTPSFGFGATGATNTTGSSGFSFGGTSTTAATGTTTTPSFGFGASSAATKPPLFGQKAATPSTSAGFGFGASSTGTTSTFGGFGSTAAKPATGGFGTTASTGSTFGSSFGTGTTGFGTSSTTPSAFSGAGATSTFGAAPAAVNVPPPIICGADPSVAQLNSIKYAYQDATQSRFKFLMYNTVDPTQRHMYARPPHISERLWDQAELDNPDPLNCVPVPILGFKDLLKRIQVQQDYAEKYNKYTDDLRKQLKDMEKTSRATEEKLEKCRLEHVKLFHSLVKVMKDIEFLQNLGKPLQKPEMELAMALKKLQALLDAPLQYKARLNDAVALHRIQECAPPTASNQMSPEDLQKMYHFLDKQRQGLEHLTNILNDDLADIKLMRETWRR
ncbi:TPA: hypothetical protein N0F65_010147, partial [Lagenidium giganteum]